MMSETSAGSLKISKPQLPEGLCGCRQEIYYEMQKQMKKSSAESDSQQVAGGVHGQREPNRALLERRGRENARCHSRTRQDEGYRRRKPTSTRKAKIGLEKYEQRDCTYSAGGVSS